jgi:succinate dehydrogenase/fumarate reductase flavoprotein subunit
MSACRSRSPRCIAKRAEAPTRGPIIPARDDQTWLKHSLYYRDGDRMDYKPVRTKPLTVESFPPKERVY